MGKPETNGIFADHYLLKERLVSGGVEEVWKAEDWTAEGAAVTLRLFGPQIRLDQHSLDMLLKDQSERASLDHPYLLSPVEFSVSEGIPFEVTPFQSRHSLTQALLINGPLPEAELALMISQVADALDYLHSRQPPFLHRQIAPESIMLSPEGDYMLSTPSISAQLRTVLHRATGTPQALGTAYAAPELFGPHPAYSEASDVFAFGVTLYELCTGELPWLGNGGLSLSQGADIPFVPAPYSRFLSNLIRACLHLDPGKRPSARVLAEEAAYYQENNDWKPYGAFGHVTAESITYRKRPSLWWALLASVLLLGGLGAVYYFFLRDTESDLITADQPAVRMEDTSTQAAAGGILPLDTPSKQAVQDTPAKPLPSQRQKVATTKPAPRAAARTKPVPPAKPKYPRPRDLEGYLNGLLNEEIPLEVREQWRPAIRGYFSPDAIISAKMNDAPLGSFGVAEFMDILLSSEEGNTILIDEIIRDEEENTIEEITVNIISVE